MHRREISTVPLQRIDSGETSLSLLELTG
jgi:hypothetical protein